MPTPTFAHAPRRPLISPPRSALLALACLGATAPAAARAQVYASVTAYRFADTQNGTSFGLPDCSRSATGSGGVSVSAGCFVPPIPGGGGTLYASGRSAYDPTAGTLKSYAALDAERSTFAQFVPTLDADGNRVYTGEARPDAVIVSTSVGFSDTFRLNASPGALPATISFFIDLDGNLQAAATPDEANTFATGFVNFCSAPRGECRSGSTTAFSGGLSSILFNDGSSSFTPFSSAPPGGTPPTLTFDGQRGPTFARGRLTLDNIPVSASAPFDFAFLLGTQVGIFHPTLRYGQTPPGCTPGVDADCPVVDPVEVTGDVIADFARTITFAGYEVRDASGRDITSSVRLAFGSGLVVPGATVVTPEPGTLALAAAGLALVGAAARRRRAGPNGAA